MNSNRSKLKKIIKSDKNSLNSNKVNSDKINSDELNFIESNNINLINSDDTLFNSSGSNCFDVIDDILNDFNRSSEINKNVDISMDTISNISSDMVIDNNNDISDKELFEFVEKIPYHSIINKMNRQDKIFNEQIKFDERRRNSFENAILKS